MVTNTLPDDVRGVHNFRDMGGYPVENGCRVRKGLLFRSGVMTGLSEDDRLALQARGVAAIVDLRDNQERARKPTSWHEGSTTAYHCRDHALSIGDLSEALRSGGLTSQRSDAIMTETYRTLPFEQSDAYRQVMALIIDGTMPLIFNCTAGKDRTGLLAALILYALGADRSTIDHDYALSNAAVADLLAIMASDTRYPGIATLPPADYLPLMRAEPHYLSAAFDAIIAQCGSIDAYLASHLGLDTEKRALLKERLLD